MRGKREIAECRQHSSYLHGLLGLGSSWRAQAKNVKHLHRRTLKAIATSPLQHRVSVLPSVPRCWRSVREAVEEHIKCRLEGSQGCEGLDVRREHVVQS